MDNEKIAIVNSLVAHLVLASKDLKSLGFDEVSESMLEFSKDIFADFNGDVILDPEKLTMDKYKDTLADILGA